MNDPEKLLSACAQMNDGYPEAGDYVKCCLDAYQKKISNLLMERRCSRWKID